MKAKLYLILIIFLNSLQGYSQYSITAFSPPPQFTHDDLWNLTVTRANLNDGFSQFTIGLRIFNSSNQLEVKTNSAIIALNTNSFSVNLANISTVKPFTIAYYNGTVLQQVISNGGLFPSGVYNIQFFLTGKPSDGDFIELANFTMQVTVDAVWPPLLVSPYDNDTINTTTPTLIWTPAFSSSFTDFIYYNVDLVEVLAGQSKEQAILRNKKIYSGNMLPSTFHLVESPLNIDKTYAWRVKASLGSLELYSQIWVFKIPLSPINFNIPDNGYVELTPTPGAFIYLAKNNKLFVRYDEEYNLPSTHANLQYKIYDYKGRVIVQNSCTGVSPCVISSEVNYILFNLTTLGLESGKFYLLEVSNLKGEKLYVKFRPHTGATQPYDPPISN